MSSACESTTWSSSTGARLLVWLIVVGLASGCGTKPSVTSSARMERSQGSSDAAKMMGDGTKALMDSIQKPTSPFHFSYKGQKNINSRVLQDDPQAKPEIGLIELDAEVTPDELDIKSTRGKKTSETKAKKSDELGWGLAQMELTGTLAHPMMLMAFAGAVGRSAGTESVGSVAADKYDFDSSTATGAQKAGFAMVAAMMGGKVKTNSIKGSVWVDKATGRTVKFNMDSEMSASSGNSWNEHDELLVTPK